MPNTLHSKQVAWSFIRTAIDYSFSQYWNKKTKTWTTIPTFYPNLLENYDFNQGMVETNYSPPLNRPQGVAVGFTPVGWSGLVGDYNPTTNSYFGTSTSSDTSPLFARNLGFTGIGTVVQPGTSYSVFVSGGSSSNSVGITWYDKTGSFISMDMRTGRKAENLLSPFNAAYGALTVQSGGSSGQNITISFAGMVAAPTINVSNIADPLYPNVGEETSYTFLYSDFNGDWYWTVATINQSGRGYYASYSRVKFDNPPVAVISNTNSSFVLGNQAILRWTYTDLDGDKQATYRVKAYSDVQHSQPNFDPAIFPNPILDSGVVKSSDYFYVLPSTAGFSTNKNYWFYVYVTADNGGESFTNAEKKIQFTLHNPGTGPQNRCFVGDISIDGLDLNVIDVNGVRWMATDVTGWWTTPDISLPDIDRAVYDDGSYDADGRYKTRIITITGSFAPLSASQVPVARNALLTYSNLVRRQGKLYFREGPDKFAKVRLSDKPQIVTSNINGTTDFQLVFRANNPRKYAVEQSNYTISPVINTPGTFAPPLTPPFSVDGVGVGGTITVFNEGDYSTEPLITITGPCLNPRVTNVTTGQYIEVDTFIPDGSVLTIDMDNRNISLDGASRRGYMARLSDWWYLNPGYSIIRFETAASSGSEASTMTIQYNSAWIF